MKKYFAASLIMVCALVFSCQSKPETKAITSSKTAKKTAKIDGEKIFKMNCVVCHGADGKLGINGAKDLSLSELSLEEKIELVKKGKNVMTGFEALLSEDQIKAVVDYTNKL